MGPFELMDLTGIDINYNVAEYLFKEMNKELKWTPPRLIKNMVKAGRWAGRRAQDGTTIINSQGGDMAYETLLIEKEEGVAIVKLNRPPVNSLNVKAYREIYDAFCELEKDDSVRAIVFTAVGEKVFAAGLDVKEVAGKSVPEYYAFGKISRGCLDKIAGISKPTIAAVFGFVLGGGCELALACDLRIAIERCQDGLPRGQSRDYSRLRRHPETAEARGDREGKRAPVHGRYRERR